MNYPDFSIEKKHWAAKQIVAGVDEVGRGCIAGPVCAASVIFSESVLINDLNDSKKLSEKKRVLVYSDIFNKALSIEFAFVDNLIIDEINILQSSMKAMTMSIEKLNPQPTHLLIDGNYFTPFFISYETIVKGDSKSSTIAAASIIAKVTRDKWMTDIADKEFPEYNFKKNKGYGTKEHYEAIDKYGICKYHRKSFLKKYFERK